MKSLRYARLEYWRRYRMIARRHRPLPQWAGWSIMSDDALIGIDLDAVLEGPEQLPICPVGRSRFVQLPPLTSDERRTVRANFYRESGFCCGIDPEVRA